MGLWPGKQPGCWLRAALVPSRDLAALGIPGGVPNLDLGTAAQDSLCAGPGGAETTTLALQIRHLYFFSLKVSYQTAPYFIPTDGLVCLYRTTGQPSHSFTSPQAQSPEVTLPVPTQLLPASSGIAAAGSGVHVPSPPTSRHGSSAVPGTGSVAAPSLHFCLTLPQQPSNTFPTPSCKQPRWTSISSGPSPKPARAEGDTWHCRGLASTLHPGLGFFLKP